MGTAMDFCRYIKVLLTPYLRAFTMGIDLSKGLGLGRYQSSRESPAWVTFVG